MQIARRIDQRVRDCSGGDAAHHARCMPIKIQSAVPMVNFLVNFLVNFRRVGPRATGPSFEAITYVRRP